MEILCTADFHGDTSHFDRLKGEKADLLVIAGDLTDFGGQNDAREIMELLEGTAPRTMAVQGNSPIMTSPSTHRQRSRTTSDSSVLAARIRLLSIPLQNFQKTKSGAS